MEDPSFNLKGIHIVNVILTYFYLGLLIMCFILSLGNRPQGSKWGYTAAFIGFGIITIYMTVNIIVSAMVHDHMAYDVVVAFQVAAFLLAFKGIQNIAAVEGRPLGIGDIFTNHIFRNIVISLLATLGLYIISSLIFVSDSS